MENPEKTVANNSSLQPLFDVLSYVKANSLYWDDSWTSEGEDKWDATRKEIIKQIEEAEKNATGSTTNSSDEDEDDDVGFWDWFG